MNPLSQEPECSLGLGHFPFQTFFMFIYLPIRLNSEMSVPLVGLKRKDGRKGDVKILIVSDLHVGSKFALAEPTPEYALNNVQKLIYNQWLTMIKDAGKVDYLVVNGDITDGTSYAEEGLHQWTNDVDAQIENAMELVKKIDYDKLLVTYGSGYHVRRNPNADRTFALRMNADEHGYELFWKPAGTTSKFHVQHKISVSLSSWQYRTTSLAREMVLALLNEHVWGSIDVLVRSHAHYFVSVAFTKSLGFITPCWEARTPYLVEKGLAGVPKLGYVLLVGREKDGEWSWDLLPRTFDIPVKPMEV